MSATDTLSMPSTLTCDASMSVWNANRARMTAFAALSWPLAGGITVVEAEAGLDLKFSSWTQVEPGSRVLGGIPPQWDAQGRLWWVRRDSDGILALCHLENTLQCSQIPVDALQDLVVEENTVWASVASGWSWSDVEVFHE